MTAMPESLLDRVLGPKPPSILPDAITLVAGWCALLLVIGTLWTIGQYVAENYQAAGWYVIQFAGIEGPGFLVALTLTRALLWLD